ncbi:hypothetical protein [Paraburkholderia youngii]
MADLIGKDSLRTVPPFLSTHRPDDTSAVLLILVQVDTGKK